MIFKCLVHNVGYPRTAGDGGKVLTAIGGGSRMRSTAADGAEAGIISFGDWGLML